MNQDSLSVVVKFFPYSRHVHVEEQRSQCLWTDGVSYFVGWWSRDERKIFVRNADSTSGAIDDSKIEAWAKLPNLFAAMKDLEA